MAICTSKFDDLDLPEMLACMAEIPGHNPERYETSDGLDDPSLTNGGRAALAAKTLDCFQKDCDMDVELETAGADLISNLLHLSHANGCNLQGVLRAAVHNFLCEAGELPSTLDPE